MVTLQNKCLLDFIIYGCVLILGLEAIEARPVRVDGLREFFSYRAEIFVIPETHKNGKTNRCWAVVDSANRDFESCDMR